MNNFRKSFFMLCWLICFMPASSLFAFAGDSLLPKSSSRDVKQREVRNYIRPTLYMNFFGTGSRIIKSDPSFPSQIVTHKLGNYKFVTANIGMYIPLYTNTKFSKNDSSTINTFHLLMTINGLSDQPQFAGLSRQHKLYKLGAGLRVIYGFGSKFILFVDASPYIVGDKLDTKQTQEFRFASSAIFNVMLSPSFSIRGGVTKTFLFGNRNYLPMLGFRIGKLDSKFYFSIQFPRMVSFNFQPTPKFSFSLYSKAYGGLYNLSNNDSLYIFGDSIIQLGQSGISNGLRLDFRPSPNFSFFLAGGFSVNNHIWLYAPSFNIRNHSKPFTPYYKGAPDPAIFINFGMTWRFGKAKKSSGNYLMYDIFDLNNTMDPGDNNAGPGNGDIRNNTKESEMQKVQYKDVSDLIEDTDLY